MMWEGDINQKIEIGEIGEISHLEDIPLSPELSAVLKCTHCITKVLQCTKHKDSIFARPSPLSSVVCQIFSSRKVGIPPQI
jgi:hypothetical protein